MVLSVLLLLLLLQVFAVSHVGEAVYTLQVHRALQMDLSSTSIGSRRTLVSLPGVSPASAAKQHTIAVLRLAESDVTPSEVVRIVDDAKAGGLLLLIPEGTAANSTNLSRWKEIEASIFQREYNVPVYFAFEDKEILSIVSDLQAGDGGDRHQFVVSGREATPQTSVPQLSNIVGWLRGSAASPGVIAVVAPYDAMSGVPSLSFSVASHGSAAATLLATIPALSLLYSQEGTQPSQDLVFVLVAGESFSQSGSSAWLRSLPSAVLENLDMVLCLHDLTLTQLNLHVSEPVAQERLLGRLLAGLQDGGKVVDIGINVIDHGSDSSEKKWSHEVFSRRHISAATLSSQVDVSDKLLGGSGLFDRRELVDESVVLRNVECVVQGIARVLYDDRVADVHMSEGVFAPSQPYVTAMLDFFGRQPRFAPTLTPSSTVVTQLRKEMARRLDSVEINTFELGKEYVFYGSVPLQMSTYRVKPFTFDLALCAGVLGYLGLLYGSLTLIKH